MFRRGYNREQGRRRAHWLAALVVGCGLWGTLCAAQDQSAGQNTEDEVVFVPPASGVPLDRLGAGTRDIDAESGPIRLLSPREGGLSAKSKPVLFWHFETAVQGPLTVAVAPVGGLARGFVVTRAGDFAPGFHALDLSGSRYALAPGQLYRWQVTARAGASGWAFIEHRPLETPPDTAAKAAAAGYWYDALAHLFSVTPSGTTRLQNAPGLASLSRSVGLDLTKFPDGQE